ncbi:MAG: GTP 3',8-cyclase MoaA [Planctomycetota bacterium]|jgi:cyclic pyranopterin phosphate synthase
MLDAYGRQIDYLRVSVTDRCNLRCRYCMPEDGVPLLKHSDILSFEEIVTVVRTAVEMGITKVRLTGGEPLVRRGVVNLVESIAAIGGIKELTMTTNGLLLSDYAEGLVLAGMGRINISLDTVDPERYRRLTRGGEIQQVFEGIDAALNAGLKPIKLNCVVSSQSTSVDTKSVQAYGRQYGLEVRVIQQMTFSTGCFSIVQGGTGGDCKQCNRIRLSSDGKIRPCLFSDAFYDTRKLGAAEAIQRAVTHKPENGKPCGHAAMQAIGG